MRWHTVLLVAGSVVAPNSIAQTGIRVEIPAWRVRQFNDLLGTTALDAALRPDGTLVVLTRTGLSSFDGVRWHQHPMPAEHRTGRPTRLLQLRDGRVLAYGFRRVAEFDADLRFRAIRIRAVEGFELGFRTAVELANGNVLFGGRLGLLEWQPGTPNITLRSNQGTLAAIRTIGPPRHWTLEPIASVFEGAERWLPRWGVHVIGTPPHAAVSAVAPGSSADTAGLRAGDRVLEYGPTEVPNQRALTHERDGQRRLVTLTGARHEGSRQTCDVATLARNSSGRIYAGLESGVIVVRDPETGRWSRFAAGSGYQPDLLTLSDGQLASCSSRALRTFDDLGRLASEQPTPWESARVRVTHLAKIRDVFLVSSSDDQVWAFGNNEWYKLDFPGASSGRVRLLAGRALWAVGSAGVVTRLPEGLDELTYRGSHFIADLGARRSLFERSGEGLVATGPDTTPEPVPVSRPSDRIINAQHDSATTNVLVKRGTGRERHTVLLQFDGRWREERVPEDISFQSVISRSPDGALWIGPTRTRARRMLRLQDGRWTEATLPSRTAVAGLAYDSNGAPHLAAYDGLYRLSEDRFVRYPTPELAHLARVVSLSQAPRGSMVLVTRNGQTALRRDGRWRWLGSEQSRAPNIYRLTWDPYSQTVWGASRQAVWRLVDDRWRLLAHNERPIGTELVAGRDGLWMNYGTPNIGRPGTICHVQENIAPSTRFSPAAQRIDSRQPVVVSWRGEDLWNQPERLEYSHRVDSGPWSAFGSDRQLVLDRLTPGPHRIEVRCRDDSLNLESPPSRFDFEVTRPIWRTPWFLFSTGGLVLAALLQSWRVWRRGRLLELDRARASAAESDRLRLEAEARSRDRTVQAQKLEALGRLSGGIAHDFNNLLTAIVGHCDLAQLAHEDADDQSIESALTAIRAAADRATQLTQRLLMIGRRRPAKPKPVEPAPILEQLQRMFGPVFGEKVTVTLQCAEETPNLFVDQTMYEQVLLNLLVNANDALSEEGGRIRVTCGPHELNHPKVTSHGERSAGSYVRTTVEDNGHGFDHATRERMFEPFFTTKPGSRGTGLGLSTAFGVIDSGGGFIEVSSEVGEGARFDVYFPATEEPAAPTIPDHDDSPAKRRGEILLCEDNDLVRSLAERVLKEQGYKVHTVVRAEHALDLSLGRQEPFDLLLTDIVLPGVDGLGLARALRQRFPGLRVLYMTGFAKQILSERGKLIDGLDLIEKPFSANELLRHVAQSLGSRPQDF